METRQLETEFKTENNTLVGYALVFNSPTQIRTATGSFTEVIKPNSVKFAEDVLCTFNHSESRLLGRMSSGTLTLTQDNIGVKFSVKLPESAKDIKELIERGDLKGASFTFQVKPNGQRWKDNTRELTDIEVSELGPVISPAYPSTNLSLREKLQHMTSEQRAKLIQNAKLILAEENGARDLNPDESAAVQSIFNYTAPTETVVPTMAPVETSSQNRSVRDLREQRARLIANAKIIVDEAEGTGRDLTEAENAQIQSLFSQADTLETQAVSEETKSKVYFAVNRLKTSAGRKTMPGKLASQHVSDKDVQSAFRAWALGKNAPSDLANRAALLGVNHYANQLEIRALSKSTSNAPIANTFQAQYEKVLKYYFPVGNAVSVIDTLDGRDLDMPVVNDTANAAAIVGEASSIAVNVDPTFSKYTLKAWKYASPIVKVSMEALQDWVYDLEAFLSEAFAERMGRAFEAAVVSTNAGSAAPEGLLNGITIVENLGADNAITLANLLHLETSVDFAYRSSPNCGWLMSDSVWGAIRGLADEQGFPIFLGNLQEGAAPRLLGYPVFLSNTMPAVTADVEGTSIIAFGDFSKYKFRKVQGSTLVRLDELYAATGEVGFVLLERADGRVAVRSAVKALGGGAVA